MYDGNLHVTTEEFNHTMWFAQTVTDAKIVSMPGAGNTAVATSVSGDIYDKDNIHHHIGTFIPVALNGESNVYICKDCDNKMCAAGNGGLAYTSSVKIYNIYGVVPVSYKVRYNANGGTGTMSDTDAIYQGSDTLDSKINYYYYKEYKLRKNTFTKSGYKFVGWNTKSDGTGDWYLDENIFRDLANTEGAVATLYAQWEKLPYKITFDIQGGSYSYTGNDNKVLVHQKNNGYLQSLEGNKKMWLGADGSYYKEFSDSDWDSTENRSKVAYVLTPNKTGEQFIGWYAPDGTKVFDAGGRCVIKSVMQSNYFKSDTTLQAKYQKEIKVTFDTQGGTFTYVNGTVVLTQSTTGYLRSCYGIKNRWLGDSEKWLAACIDSEWDNSKGCSTFTCVMGASKEHAIFKGWYTADGTKVFDELGRCTVKEVMSATYFTKDTTLYARYYEEFKITFDAQGGIYSYTGTNSVLLCQKNNGYMFSYYGYPKRWLGDGDVWYIDIEWDNTNGCTKSTCVLIPTKANAKFTGWYKSDGTKVFDADGKCVIKDVLASNYFSSNTTLYAHYTESIKITFNTQGGSYSYSETNKVLLCQKNNGYMLSYYGDADRWLGDGTYWYSTFKDSDWDSTNGYCKNRSVLCPTKDGSGFAGWYTADGVKVFDDSGRCVIKEVMQANYFDEDVTLYAHYTTSIKITFDTQGGSYSYTGTDKTYLCQKNKGYLMYYADGTRAFLGDGTEWGLIYSELTWDSVNNHFAGYRVLVPEKTDQYFTGWYTADGIKVFDAGGYCIIKDLLKPGYFSSDITLYAHYNTGAVKMSFDTQGGSYSYTGTNSTMLWQKSNGYVMYELSYGAVYFKDDGSAGIYMPAFTESTWDNVNGCSPYACVLPAIKAGATFTGWYMSDGTKVFDAVGKCVLKDLLTPGYISEGITLYAHYIEAVKITFDIQGGSYSYTGSDEILLYQKNNGCLYTYTGNADKWLGYDTHWYIKFTESMWNSTEGHSESSCVLVPTKTNASFSGWYTSDGIKVFDLYGRCVIKDVMTSNYFSNDTTLYAHYNSVIKITFDTQGGSYSYSGTNSVLKCQKDNGYMICETNNPSKWLGDGTYWYGAFEDSDWDSDKGYSNSAYVLPVRKSGRSFAGWFTAPTGGTKVFNKDGRCVIKSVMTSEYFIGDITLYAQFYSTGKITVEAYGGTYGRLDEPRNSVCYYFSRYLQDKGYFYTSVSDGIFVYRPSPNTSLKASWDDSDWSSSEGRSMYYIFDPPTREGYIYGGIFTEPNGQGDQLFDAGTGYCVSKDLLAGTKFATDTTVYVYWIPLSFDITWNYSKPTDSSGSLICDPKPDKTSVDYTVSKWNGVTYPSPSLAGWKFLGWYNGNTRYDTRTDDITIGQRVNITLTAKWERIGFSIKYSKGDSDK